MNKEQKLYKRMSNLLDTVQVANYYKSRYAICGNHTGFNEGHMYNCWYFKSLTNARKYLKLTERIGNPSMIWKITHELNYSLSGSKHSILKSAVPIKIKAKKTH